VSNLQKKIVVAITGASGSIYPYVLLKKLSQMKNQISEISLVMSDNSKAVWKHELENESYKDFDFKIYAKQDFFAPFASGSSKYDSMIVCPCSMGTLGRIASGISDDLITRAADVMLKERRRLILVTRETPLNLIHIQNMKVLTESGGIICPATPSFYSRPKNMEEMAGTVIDRVIDLCQIENNAYRWGN
jgi:4-hydroxy-3-polyprenylbenzoate decarboxylase